METNRLDPLANGFASRFIRLKARQLVQRPEFGSADLEDVEQDLKLQLWRRFPKYDPRRGSLQGFIKTVVERQAATLIKRRKARGRWPTQSVRSLDRSAKSPAGFAQVLTTEDRLRHRHIRPRSELQQICLSHDVNCLLASLPSEKARLCRQFLHSGSISETARQMGIPRSTVSDRMHRLIKPFEEAALHKYL